MINRYITILIFLIYISKDSYSQKAPKSSFLADFSAGLTASSGTNWVIDKYYSNNLNSNLGFTNIFGCRISLKWSDRFSFEGDAIYSFSNAEFTSSYKNDYYSYDYENKLNIEAYNFPISLKYNFISFSSYKVFSRFGVGTKYFKNSTYKVYHDGDIIEEGKLITKESYHPLLFNIGIEKKLNKGKVFLSFDFSDYKLPYIRREKFGFFRTLFYYPIDTRLWITHSYITLGYFF